MSKIIFLVQQLTQPRCLKRIESIAAEGYDYEVYGFNNGLYEKNISNTSIKITEVWNINKYSKNISKISNYYKLVKYVLSLSKERDVLYCFGFELGALCAIFNYRRRYIYEEADIFASRYENYFIRTILIYFDRWIIRRAALTVFTSKEFVRYIFKNKSTQNNKILVIENKLHPYFRDIKRETQRIINANNLTFGFVGLIRYPDTILRFARIIGENFPQHNFYFFGVVDNCLSSLEELLVYDNVKYWGAYKYPNDLNKIYNEIDISVACYDTKSDNVKIAEPNKLYESIFFIKPLIVSADTYLSKRVKKLNAGYSINASDNNSILHFIHNIDQITIDSIISSISLISVSDLIINNKELINKLSLFI